MTRYMVWVQIENNEGWGCSLCDWNIATPELDTTVAALKYNHVAQQAFDDHECCVNGNGNGVKKPSGSVWSNGELQVGGF